MATHSSILAWRIPGTEEPGGVQSLGSHRVRFNRAPKTVTFTLTHPDELFWVLQLKKEKVAL